MQRTIVPTQRFHTEQLLPGVSFERFYPGGKRGPNGECLLDTPGGQVWSLAFSPDGATLAAGGEGPDGSGDLLLWRTDR